MTVRAITRFEAELFASAGADPERTRSVMVQLWDECRSCPEWCFIGEENGRVIARIGFWVLPSIITTFHVAWLTLPWDGDYLSAGKRFWDEVLVRIRDYGVTDVESALDSDDDNHDRRVSFYEHVGLDLIQEKAEYKWQVGDDRLKSQDRIQTQRHKDTRIRTREIQTNRTRQVACLNRNLRFRTMAEEGEAAFIEAIRRVTEGTLDREDQDAVRTESPAEAARRYFGILKDIDYTPERWQLGYAVRESGAPALVGLIAPQKFNDDVGAINYIGVVPELRGRGYVNDLMAKGLQLLYEAGVKQVVASIDVVNYPMLAAVERAGFQPDVSSRIYRLTLDRPAAGGS